MWREAIQDGRVTKNPCELSSFGSHKGRLEVRSQGCKYNENEGRDLHNACF